MKNSFDLTDCNLRITDRRYDLYRAVSPLNPR